MNWLMSLRTIHMERNGWTSNPNLRAWGCMPLFSIHVYTQFVAGAAEAWLLTMRLRSNTYAFAQQMIAQVLLTLHDYGREWAIPGFGVGRWSQILAKRHWFPPAGTLLNTSRFFCLLVQIIPRDKADILMCLVNFIKCPTWENDRMLQQIAPANFLCSHPMQRGSRRMAQIKKTTMAKNMKTL